MWAPLYKWFDMINDDRMGFCLETGYIWKANCFHMKRFQMPMKLR